MTKIKRGLILALSTAMVSATAYAGFVQPAVVDVDLANGFAQGDTISARDSGDTVSFIGCGTRLTSDGVNPVFRFGFCQAQDAEEEIVTCFTQDSDLLDEMRVASDSSYITFSWTDDGFGNLTCTRVGFSNQSFYLDKHTKSNL